MRRTLSLLLVAVLVAGILLVAVPVRAEKPKVVVASAAPLYLGLKYYEEQAEKDLGIEVELVEIPWANLYEKVMTDVATGAGEFDVFLVPNDWIGEFATAGYIVPLDEFIEKVDVALDDILPHLRERLMKWGGKYYAVMFDGDCHLFYYRKDILANPEARKLFKEQFGYDLPCPPKTWKEVIDVAKFFTENLRDWDGDGVKEYGIGISAKRGAQTQWTVLDVIASLIKPSEKYGIPIVYFDPETGEPLVNSPPWKRAFEIYKELIKYGPPGILDFDVGDVRARFTRGELVLAIDWGDIGPLSIAPDSKVKGKVGFSPLPGSYEVYSFEEKRWIKLDKPYRPAVLNFGGWCFFISKLAKDKELAFKYVAYMARPERANYLAIAKGETGVNIFRYSQFFDVNKDLWLKVGWDAESAKQYCDTIKAIYENPNPVWDIRVPGFKRFWDAFDAAISDTITGVKSVDQALSDLYDEWKMIIEDIGPEDFLKWYREDLGISG